MKILFMIIYLLVSITGYASAETLYRWVDKDGKVHYGDRPAEDAVKAEPKKFSTTGASGDEELPYSVRKAKQDFPVTLYVAPNCGEFCVKARILLNNRGVPFTEINLITKEDIDSFKAKISGAIVPLLMIGRNPVVGFDADQWNGELDFAGYPKTAPYGSRPIQPAASSPEVSDTTKQ